MTPRSDGEEKQHISDPDDSSGKRNGIAEKGPLLVTTSSQPKYDIFHYHFLLEKMHIVLKELIVSFPTVYHLIA